MLENRDFRKYPRPDTKYPIEWLPRDPRKIALTIDDKVSDGREEKTSDDSRNRE